MKLNFKSLSLIRDKDKKFEIFYKYRFNNEYLKNNIDKKKILKKKFKKNFDTILKHSFIYLIYLDKKKIGLIYYNKKNSF